MHFVKVAIFPFHKCSSLVILKSFFALFFYFHPILSLNLRVEISIYRDFIKFYQSIQQRWRYRECLLPSNQCTTCFIFVKVADFIIYHAILYFPNSHSDVMLIKVFEIKLHTGGHWNKSLLLLREQSDKYKTGALKLNL